MKPPKTPNAAAASPDGEPAERAKARREPPPPPNELDAANPPPGPAPRAAPAPRPHNYATAAFIGVVLALAVLAGAGYATRPLWSPYVAALVAPPDDPAQAVSIAELKARLATLEAKAGTNGLVDAAFKDLEADRARLSKEVDTLMKRLGGLEEEVNSVARMIQATTRPRDAAAAGQSLKELSERLSEVEQTKDVLRILNQRVEAMGSSEAADAEKNRLDDLIARNEKITSLVSGLAKKVGALEGSQAYGGVAREHRVIILTIERLREILHSSAPFGEELAGLKTVSAGRPDLLAIAGDLEPYAAGAPTLAVVQRRFDAAATHIAAAAHEIAGDGWVERTVSRLSSLVTVRRTDAVADDTVDASLARAEVNVADGNLIAAVKIVEGLTGPAAAAAAPWLKDARARIAIERALAALHVHAVSLLNAAGE